MSSFAWLALESHVRTYVRDVLSQHDLLRDITHIVIQRQTFRVGKYLCCQDKNSDRTTKPFRDSLNSNYKIPTRQLLAALWQIPLGPKKPRGLFNIFLAQTLLFFKETPAQRRRVWEAVCWVPSFLSRDRQTDKFSRDQISWDRGN